MRSDKEDNAQQSTGCYWAAEDSAMRSDKEDNAQQSTVDDPTTTKRSPLKETPSSLQRLRQAIAEEVGERRISAAVGRLRNMQVCDHGPTPHVASERRQRQVQEFEGFCADKGAQAQCCQYDCARHEECHGALAMIHGVLHAAAL